MSDLLIRPARLEDAVLVATLVAELADQQGDPTEHISAEAFRRDAFKPSPEFEVLLAEPAAPSSATPCSICHTSRATRRAASICAISM